MPSLNRSTIFILQALQFELFKKSRLKINIHGIVAFCFYLATAQSYATGIESRTTLRLKHVPYAFSIPSKYFSGSQSVDLANKEIDQLEFTLLFPNFETRLLGERTFQTRPLDGFDQRVDVMTVQGKTRFTVLDNKHVRLDQHSTIRYILDNHHLVAEMYGLKCYSLTTKPIRDVSLPCIGHRSNGEILLMYAGDSINPTRCRSSSCDVHYYSDQAQLHINYRFSRIHIQSWREIDDAIWANLNTWRMK